MTLVVHYTAAKILAMVTRLVADSCYRTLENRRRKYVERCG